ncbi:hypothetical protein OS493_010638 [Desmophyllum pertusum]|uniref:RNase H type-1 domain-containing protein n=1 Tax=Desmophyllum pertusum TaxID=174260 RepID=A0A9W9ZSA5_9CNID|nr:hypothetical protein OS493_010638 [Desmophyllum pertusum]
MSSTANYIWGKPPKTSGEAILHYMGFLNKQQTYKLQAAQEYIRALTTESHPLYNELQNHSDLAVRLQRVIPWIKAAKDTLEEVVPVDNIQADPWVAYNNKPILVDSVGDRTWEERDKAINNAEVSQYLESKEANIIIATDGSIRDNISAWGGAVWQKNRRTFEWCAGKQDRTSSFRAESDAYEDALIWMRNNTTEEDRVVELTDSLGLVTRLKRGLVKEPWADHHTTYIPGHAGIWYNEIADQLAGAAEPIGPMQLHPSDVRNRMREAVREKPPPTTTWWSLSRMESADIKFGHGANQRTRGKATRIITQRVAYNNKPLLVDSVGDRTWEERDKAINNAEVSQYLESKEANIIIATDGLIRDNIPAWGGAVWQNNRRTFEWCAGKQDRTSSFRAESDACEDTLIWMRNNTTEEDRVVELTNSLGLVTRLNRGLADHHTTYIPGHAGIWYNEFADQLAGAAEPIGPMQLHPSDVRNRMREAVREKPPPTTTWWSSAGWSLQISSSDMVPVSKCEENELPKEPQLIGKEYNKFAGQLFMGQKAVTSQRSDEFLAYQDSPLFVSTTAGDVTHVLMQAWVCRRCGLCGSNAGLLTIEDSTASATMAKLAI